LEEFNEKLWVVKIEFAKGEVEEGELLLLRFPP